MLMYQKSMFDCYHCITTFCCSKTLENLLRKVFFSVPIMAQESTLPANIYKTPLPGQRLDITNLHSLLCRLLMIMSVFVMVPECLFVKPQSRALTALTWICAG